MPFDEDKTFCRYIRGPHVEEVPTKNVKNMGNEVEPGYVEGYILDTAPTQYQLDNKYTLVTYSP